LASPPPHLQLARAGSDPLGKILTHQNPINAFSVKPGSFRSHRKRITIFRHHPVIKLQHIVSISDFSGLAV
jgi:hypothetical protein